MSDVDPKELAALDDQIANLSVKLGQAKLVVKQWTNTSTQLARSAAEERAKIQGIRAFLGSKSMRSAAAQGNAKLAKEVAEKRTKIAEGKMQAQEAVRRLQAELNSAKERRKSLIALAKMQSKTQTKATKAKIDSITLLKKLKEAYDLGLLTKQEYDQKRQKLVSDL